MSGYKPVAIDDVILHPEIVGSVPDQLVELFESPVIEQQLNALACA